MSKYHFDVKPDNTSWSLYMPEDKRLMGKGNPFTDKHLTEFLEGIDKGQVCTLLEYMMNRYGIHGKRPVLMDANNEGFKLVKGDVAILVEKIGRLLQQLVDSSN
jgi:hypothetical protein